jgi:GNAT superfamily N-acetyltransferase
MNLAIEAPDGDLRLLQDIEREAGVLFRQAGLEAVADAPPTDIGKLLLARRQGWLRVAVVEGQVAGFVLGAVEARDLFFAQLSVRPRFARREIGGRLLEAFRIRANEARRERLTLSTFRDLPWNAPYYRRLGFEILPTSELPDYLRAHRRLEAAANLDLDRRVCMVAKAKDGLRLRAL